MLKRILIITLAILVVLLSGVGASCKRGYSGSVESITIANWPSEISSLIYVALQQNYFSEEGLNVTLRNYTSVTAGVNGMLKGEGDISVASEFVVVGNALKGEDFLTIGNIDKVSQTSIIGRKDHGINKVADLAGKKIGVFKGAAAEFYLGRFLELNGINQSRVTLVDTSSSNVVDIFTSGAIDTVITSQPNIDRIKDLLGDEILIWPAQSGQPTFYNALCTGRWASEHPAVIKQFLKSLDRAKSYLTKNPEPSKKAIQKQLNYDDRYISDIWQDHEFLLSLDQSLILAMEDEARWMISNNLTTQKTVPNFLDYIYTEGLKSVRPDAVRIAGK